MCMIPVFPEVLKERPGEWSFSETEPWKPVANENASDEVKAAIDEFIADVKGGEGMA